MKERREAKSRMGGDHTMKVGESMEEEEKPREGSASKYEELGSMEDVQHSRTAKGEKHEVKDKCVRREENKIELNERGQYAED